LPDSAAEILVNFREQLASIFDIETGLNVLTEAAHADHMPSKVASANGIAHATDRSISSIGALLPIEL
jgi:hypothetical protein